MASLLILSRPSLTAIVTSGLRAAALLFLRRPAARAIGRGDWPALNGQVNRERALAMILGAYRPDLIVETGTYLGSSTRWLAGWEAPVLSAEVNPKFFLASALRLRAVENVTLALGSSLELLQRLAREAGRYSRPLFYLDAHWEGRLPLWDELELIWGHWGTAVVVIDDFRVPGDDGYGYDAYGPTEVISLEHSRFPSGADVMFPAEPSSTESGRRRGTCYVAVGPAASAALTRGSKQRLLRPHASTSVP
jgi:hypothetical protein